MKARKEATLARRAARDGYRPPEHRPDKRARRLIRALGDIDALLSICQVPGQVPLGTVGLHSKAGLNACMFAHRILKLAE